MPSVPSFPSDMPLANPSVVAMHAYTPGEQPDGSDWVKLNTNENPYPPSPRVAEALLKEIDFDGARLRLYPNPSSRPLREALAKLHGVSTDWILAGNGSDDILNLLMRVFAGPDRPAGMTTPSYSLYPVLAALQNAPLLEVPFDRTFALDPARIAPCGANIFFLTSPNAPSGVGFPTATIAEIAKNFPASSSWTKPTRRSPRKTPPTSCRISPPRRRPHFLQSLQPRRRAHRLRPGPPGNHRPARPRARQLQPRPPRPGRRARRHRGPPLLPAHHRPRHPNPRSISQKNRAPSAGSPTPPRRISSSSNPATPAAKPARPSRKTSSPSSNTAESSSAISANIR